MLTVALGWTANDVTQAKKTFVKVKSDIGLHLSTSNGHRIAARIKWISQLLSPDKDHNHKSRVGSKGRFNSLKKTENDKKRALHKERATIS